MNVLKKIFSISLLFFFVTMVNAQQSFKIRDMGVTVNALNSSEQIVQGQNSVYMTHDGSTSMTIIYCKYPCTEEQLKKMINSGHIENSNFEVDDKFENLALKTFGCFAQKNSIPSYIIGSLNPYGVGIIVLSHNYLEQSYGDQRFYWARAKALEVGNKLNFSEPIKPQRANPSPPNTSRPIVPISGANQCSNCSGTGMVKCADCGGSGSSMEPVFHYGPNYTSYTTYEMRVCMRCISPGKQKCKVCSGSGKRN
jgi:hypothetical protein